MLGGIVFENSLTKLKTRDITRKKRSYRRDIGSMRMRREEEGEGRMMVKRITLRWSENEKGEALKRGSPWMP